MGIFYRRPLCLAAFLYMLSAALCTQLPPRIKPVIFTLLIFAALCLVIVGTVKKKWESRSVFAAILCISIGAAALLSFRSIDLKRERAEQYTGERYAYMTVVSSGELAADNASYSAYEVIIDGVRDKSLSVRATLICAFDTELYLGDKIYAFCSIFEADGSPYSFLGNIDTEGDALLSAVIYDPSDAVTDTQGREPSFLELLLRDHRFTLISARIRSSVKRAISNVFDETSAPIAKGVLTGDKSDIPSETVRDFKRTGVSHLLAVSGLHVTLLLGAAELLLRKLCVGRTKRIICVSVLALGLLIITGFSMSAVRAVLMLWLAYVFYLAAEEPDALTSLFCAVAIILTVWPSAVYELGLWMSFAATLGILTAYNFIASAVPRIKGNSPWDKIKRFLRSVLDAVILSVCATAFVIPFLWLSFGETSLVFVIVNLVLAPIVPLFLCGIPIALMLSPIPFVSGAASCLVGSLGKLIMLTVKLFSRLDGASVSLRYSFAAPIMAVFILSLSVGLIIKLKRKWISLILPTLCILAFGVSVVCFNSFGYSDSAFFYSSGENELICTTDNGGLTVVDVGGGAFDAYRAVTDEAAKYGCTYVDALVLTHMDARHELTVGYLLASSYVKTLYIPSSADANIALSLCKTAELCGTDVVLYDVERVVNIAQNARFLLVGGEWISFVLSGEQSIAYFESAAYSEKFGEVASAADTLILGAHGEDPEQRIDLTDQKSVVVSLDIIDYLDGLTTDNAKVVGEMPFDKIVKISDK